MKRVIIYLLVASLLSAVCVIGSSHVHAASWKPEYSGTASDLKGVSGIASNMILTLDSLGEVFRYDGLYWNVMAGFSGYFYQDIWAGGPGDVYIAGDGGRLFHFDGVSWSQIETGTERSLKSVWGSSSSDVFVAGWYGTMLHFDGSAWEEMDVPNFMADIRCVWGSGPNDVYAVGWEIFHYDGTSWTRILQDYSLNNDYSSVWGTSANDVFIGGDNGAILHYNGASWSEMATGAAVAIQDIWGSSPTNVYAVGAGGTVIRYNGSAWSPVDVGTDKDLYGIWGDSASDIVVVGEGGTIYHYKNWPTGTTLKLAETGQSESYYPGDDGDIEAGLDWPDPRFTDNGDGTVTDNLTGLMWMRDANLAHTLGQLPWMPPDGSMTFRDALDFAAAINAVVLPGGAGHNDWRLPNAAEMESLFNAAPCSVGMWLMDMGWFDNVHDRYWTSTTDELYWDRAWVAYVGDDSYCQGGIEYKPKENFYHTWLVRGVSDGPAPVRTTGQTECYAPEVPGEGCFQGGSWYSPQYGYCRTECAGTGQDGELQAGVSWPEPRFILNNDGTVNDRLTGLMWLKDARCFGALPWGGALDAVDGFNAGPGDYACLDYSGTYDDWRVPNRRELLSLIDYSRHYPGLPGEYFRYFPNVYVGGSAGTYWSSTTLDWCDHSQAFTVSLRDGGHWFWDKAHEWYVWPVRTAPRFSLKPHPDISVIRPWPFDIVGRPLNLDATRSLSSDPFNPIVSYQWDLDGDGLYDDASGPIVNYAWDTAGTWQVGLKITTFRGAIAIKTISLTIAEAEPVEAVLDIKPGSCENPVNLKSRGVIPVVVLGSDAVDVSEIDPATIALQGVSPVRTRIGDVSGEGLDGCPADGSDGWDDMTLKFQTQELLDALRPAPAGLLDKGSRVTLTLTGKLKPEYGGAPIRAADTITLK